MCKKKKINKYVKNKMNNDKIVLLCCTGRSGSTTLQRMINSIPNSNICGENYGAVNSLLLFYKKLKQTTFIQVPGGKNPINYQDLIHLGIKPAWYNSYHLDKMKKHIQDTILSMFKNIETTNVWGFKEIRYENGNIQLIEEFKELFPQTKVIVQIRENIDAQSQSSWFKNNPNSKQFLIQSNNQLYNFYKKNEEWVYFTSFEKMFDLKNIERIFDFIDCTTYFNESNIKEILKDNLKSD